LINKWTIDKIPHPILSHHGHQHWCCRFLRHAGRNLCLSKWRLFCWKKSYGLGVGIIPTNCSGGKVYENGLFYSKCRIGYSGNGPLCLQNCSISYKNHPLSCYKNLLSWFFKKSYGRGVGTIPISCGTGDYDAGLCYENCRTGYNGVGPVCGKTCTGSTGTDCGAACASSSNACAAKVFEQIVSVL